MNARHLAPLACAPVPSAPSLRAPLARAAELSAPVAAGHPPLFRRVRMMPEATRQVRVADTGDAAGEWAASLDDRGLPVSEVPFEVPSTYLGGVRGSGATPRRVRDAT